MRYGDKGENVRDAQQALIDQGYLLPRFGADGDLGNETWERLQVYAKDNAVTWDPSVMCDVLFCLAKETEPTPPPTPDPGVVLYDLRGEQSNPPEQGQKFKLSGGRVVVRDPLQVTGITIHQTAVKFSVAQYQIDAAGGDRELALARRSLNIACHVMAFHDGFVAWPNPIDWYVYHGNDLNSFEMGIEIDGNYPGVIGGKTWDGKEPTPVTEAVVAAARDGIRILVEQGRAMGMPIQYIHAHRQSSMSRQSDPGEELWRRVVTEYAVAVLGLTVQQSRKWDDGHPIPLEWDTGGVGNY